MGYYQTREEGHGLRGSNRKGSREGPPRVGPKGWPELGDREGRSSGTAAVDHGSPRAQRVLEAWLGWPGLGSAERQALTSAHAWLSGAGPYSSVVKISLALGCACVAAITRPDRFPQRTAGRSAQKNLEVEGQHRPLQPKGRGYGR